MNSLVENAKKAYEPVLKEQAQRAAEAEERHKRETADARTEAIANGEAVLDRVLGQHAGLTLYCMLGGVGGRDEIRNLTNAKAVRTIVYTLDGVPDFKLAVCFAGSLEASTIRTAGYMEQSADSDAWGWFFGQSAITDLKYLGMVLHEHNGQATTVTEGTDRA